MKKIILLLLFTVLFTSCELVHEFFNPYRSYQADFEKSYSSNNLTPSSTLSSLFDFNNTHWDKVVYYNAYYNIEAIEKELNIQIPYANNSYNDGEWLLVFIEKEDNKNILKYFIFGYRYEIDTIWEADKYYFRDDVYTVIERENYSRRIKITHKE